MAALWGMAMGASLAQQCPPARPAAMLERFTSAECDACWLVPPPLPAKVDASAPSMVIDWVVPSPRGGEAPLSAVAIGEAADRLAREGEATMKPDETLTRSHPLSTRGALRVRVSDGLPVNGYIGLSLNVSFASDRAPPPGLAGYVALVERVPPGEDGSPVERVLVRAVAGPLNLAALSAKRAVTHALATRIPDTRHPERLESVGWVETKKGRVIAVGSRRDDACE